MKPDEPQPPLAVDVDCYSGYRGEQTPRRFRIGSRDVAVEEVLDAWLGPDHRYFKVRGGDGDIYILRHDTFSSRWELTIFRKG